MQLGTNNLGGKGPDPGKEILEFRNVGTFQGGQQKMHLRIKTLDHKYDLHNKNQNGFYDSGNRKNFSQINLKAGHTANMEFCFVDDEGTPIILDSFRITFYDIGASSP